MNKGYTSILRYTHIHVYIHTTCMGHKFSGCRKGLLPQEDRYHRIVLEVSMLEVSMLEVKTARPGIEFAECNTLHCGLDDTCTFTLGLFVVTS